MLLNQIYANGELKNASAVLAMDTALAVQPGERRQNPPGTESASTAS